METFGAQLRSWRLARRISQEQLAERAGVSPRHLSFVETGRAQPSREVVLALAGVLDVPLRERNTLLAAAGFAAMFPASPLDGEELAHLRRAIAHVLAKQEPYGAVVIDGKLDVVQLNRGAAQLFGHFPPADDDGRAAARNIVLGVVHPGALRPYIANWGHVAGHLIARLHREVVARPYDESLRRLLSRVLAQPDVPADWRTPALGRSAAPFVTIHLRSPSLELRLFTMLTSIGTPLDVTAEELHIETYFPADDSSDAAIRAIVR